MSALIFTAHAITSESDAPRVLVRENGSYGVTFSTGGSLPNEVTISSSDDLPAIFERLAARLRAEAIRVGVVEPVEGSAHHFAAVEPVEAGMG